MAPAGGTRGSELELGTFTRKSRTRCASLSPAVSGQKSCFWTETAVSGVLFLTVNASVSGVLFLTVNASGVQKVLDRNHGVETHRARRALKRGNFFHEHVFFRKKQVLFSQKIFLMIKTVNILSFFFKKKSYKPITAKTRGAFGPQETVVLGVPTD